MTTLREFAKGKDCLVRIPGVCNFDPETTVLAHIRRGGIAGMSQKPTDLCAVFACSHCHDAIDRRGYRDIPMESINDYMLDALCRQLDFYDKHEVLVVAL
jgi:Protein of unknown function (DUF1364)